MEKTLHANISTNNNVSHSNDEMTGLQKETLRQDGFPVKKETFHSAKAAAPLGTQESSKHISPSGHAGKCSQPKLRTKAELLSGWRAQPLPPPERQSKETERPLLCTRLTQEHVEQGTPRM